jgi:hypothetical protein
MVSGSLSGGGGDEPFRGRAAIGYDHGYDGEIFYLGLALDPHYVDGWVEGCLERIGEDHPEEELLFRDLRDGETQWEVVIESLKADCEVRTAQPAGLYDRLPSVARTVTSRGSKQTGLCPHQLPRGHGGGPEDMVVREQVSSPASVSMVNTPLTPSESHENGF